MTTIPNANIAEFAAQQVEKMPSYLQVDAIAQVLLTHSAFLPEDDAKVCAEKLIEGINPMFQMVADHIRSQPISDTQDVLTARDKMVHDLTIDRIKQAAFAMVKNPAKKPRKTPPVMRQGIWYADLIKVLDAMRAGGASLEEHIASVWNQGFAEGVRKAGQRLRLAKPTFDPDGQGTRVRNQGDWADYVEETKP